MKNPTFKILLHVVGWCLFLLLPYLFSFKKAVRFDQLWTSQHELKNLLSWIFLIGFTYLNHLWLVPGFYLKRKRLLYAGLAGLGLAMILWLPESISWFGQSPPQNIPLSDVPPKPAVVMENSHVVLLFFVSILVSISYRTQIRLREAEQQRLQTELAHLKAQIQPHFLFNTLNSIYSLAIRQDERTADTVVELSDFLRYVIQDANQHWVVLEKEVDYIRNYINLQISRLRNSVAIHFEVKGNLNQQKIAPLILFSFIENAFQHGVSPDEESEIRIRITTQEDQVELFVYNKKVKVTTQEVSTGIGIENTRKRLMLLYPEKHTLQITDTNQDYSVQLDIFL